MSIIRFDNVSYAYDGGRYALDGITLDIQPGEFLCILGANGSGKSTLALHMNGLLAPLEGTVEVMGRTTDDAQSAFALRSAVGMVFQNPDDQIVASIVEDDVAFAPENLGVPGTEIRQRVTHALGAVGLAGFEQRDVSTLSGGQKQRLAIAGALAMRPKVLVLDEASAMLDPRGRAHLLELCEKLHDDGLTVVMITHFVDEAARASRAIVLESGRIVADGSPAEVLADATALRRWSLEAPFPVRLADKLAARGIAVRSSIDARQVQVDILDRMNSAKRETAQEPRPFAIMRDAATDAVPCVGERDAAVPTTSAGEDSTAEAPTTSRQTCDAVCECDVAADAAPCVGESSTAAAPAPPEGMRDTATPAPPEGAGDATAAAPSSGYERESILQFDDVTFSYPSMRAQNRRSKPGGGKAAGKAQPAHEPESERAYALANLSFCIREGEFFGIAGHTGSGKSTLMQLCNGLLQPTQGTVLWKGRDLGSKDDAKRARRDIGLVFQYPEHQLFAATVFDDVAFGPRNLGWSESEVEQAVHRALGLVHLSCDDICERNPFALSGGQQRRIAFAGVLAMQPTVLVLDEPAAGLDPLGKAQFLDLVKELHDEHGITVVLISHDMTDLAALCQRLLVLNEGRIFALDTPQRVFAHEDELKRIGLGIPEEYRCANALGIDMGEDPHLTIDSIADAIAARLRP